MLWILTREGLLSADNILANSLEPSHSLIAATMTTTTTDRRIGRSSSRRPELELVNTGFRLIRSRTNTDTTRLRSVLALTMLAPFSRRCLSAIQPARHQQLLLRYSTPFVYSARRSLATTTADSNSARSSDHPAPTNAFELSAPADVESDGRPAWASWELTQNYLYVFAIIIGGVVTVRYWYNRESEHFAHHRWQQEPYAFFIKKDDKVAEGWWPGRACQFLEFNCFAAAYDAADKLLQEKQQQHGGQHNAH